MHHLANNYPLRFIESLKNCVFKLFLLLHEQFAPNGALGGGIIKLLQTARLLQELNAGLNTIFRITQISLHQYV